MHLSTVNPGLFRIPGGDNLEKGILELVRRPVGYFQSFHLQGLLIGQGHRLHLFRSELELATDLVFLFEGIDNRVEKIPVQSTSHPETLEKPPI